jgi:DNA-binding FadR family transcriptional regulator
MRQVDQDLARIRYYIERSKLTEQQRLPPERELAETLGLTRNRLRSGLRKLEAEGMIWRHVGKGTFLGQRPLMNGADFQIPALLDVTNPREVMEARLAFEPELARLASFRANGRDFADLEHCIAKMETAPDWFAWEIWDGRLHRTIAQATGNVLMLVMFDTALSNRNREIWGRLRRRNDRPGRMVEATDEHRAIVAAIREREPERARELMRTHLRNVHRHVFGEA